MERKGAINQYTANPRHRKAEAVRSPPVFTLNLANGTTPFVKFFYGVEYTSGFYRLTVIPTVTHVWYRPGAEAFKELDTPVQDHVLNGGLLCGELNKVSTLADDPVVLDWEPEAFRAWCLAYYGRRLPPMEQPK